MPIPPFPPRKPRPTAKPKPKPIAPPTPSVLVVEAKPAIVTSDETIPVATKTADLLGPGTLATAIVAPKMGDIPVEAGTPVVLIAKHLRDTDTFKKLVRVMQIAWGTFAAFVGYKIIDHGSVWGMDWTSVGRGAIDAALLSALAVYGISLKSKFNDPAISGSLSGTAETDGVRRLR